MKLILTHFRTIMDTAAHAILIDFNRIINNKRHTLSMRTGVTAKQVRRGWKILSCYLIPASEDDFLRLMRIIIAGFHFSFRTLGKSRQATRC